MGYSLFAPTIASIPGLQAALDALTAADALKANLAAPALTGRPSITATLTDSTLPGLLLDQTWNGGSYSFTGIELRVANTASLAGGYLVNMSVDSTPRFSVYQEGCIRAQGSNLTAARPIGEFTTGWNNAGVTFKGITLNVTDTASATASRLLDLMVGSTSKFYVLKSGATLLGSYSSGGVLLPLDGGLGVNRRDISTTLPVVFIGYYAAPQVTVASGGTIGFSSNASDVSGGNSSPDTAFARVSAGVGAITNGTAGTYRDLRVRNILDTNGAIVLGTRGAAVADATDAASVITQLNALLARLRATGGHGLIAD